ncbi:hypothetical protein [Bradyrhizobium erythrophlei]|uniref:hypothetical protein n=1 Tax=Bradyrhizobium erythrophlei TaxID=1437360 RepID=UPI0012AB8DD8|nr:hypothetical protein [Bradyrhizobium erythrophlei]
MVAAVVLGLIAGVFATLLFILVAANIYEPLQPRLLPPNPSAEVFALFMLALYAFWFFALWAITRKVGQLNFVLLFLFVLPLPSIVVAYEWGKSLDERWGHRSDLTTAPNAKVRVARSVAVPFLAD